MEEETRLSIAIKENEIAISIKDACFEKICYYLCECSKGTIQKTKYQTESEYRFLLDDSGVYYIKAFLQIDGKKEILLSEIFDYVSLEDKKACESFLSSIDNPDVQLADPLHITKRDSPYNSFIICKWDSSVSAIQAFAESNKMRFEVVDGWEGIYIVSDIEGNKGMFLSGLAMYKGKIQIGGMGELLPEYLSDNNLGYFSYYKITERTIEVGTDYFGTGRIFYYQDQSCFLCGNNYHLLLLFCKYLKRSIHIDYSVMRAMFGKNYQTTYSRFSERCGIKEIKILHLDQKICIDHKLIHFCDSAIRKDIVQRKNGLTDNEYKELLLEAHNEVVENIKAVLNQPFYSTLVFDITGGVDSRVGIAAYLQQELSLETETKKTVYARSYPNYERDYKLAKCIQQIVNLPTFDPKNYEQYNYTKQEVIDDFLSIRILEGIWEPFDWCWYNDRNSQSTLGITGAHGEIFKTYYTRKIMNNYRDDAFNLTFEQIINESVSRKDILSANGWKDYLDILKEACREIPGDSPLQKYERHYLYYNNRYHFGRGGGFRWEDNRNWSSLASKSLFRLQQYKYYDNTETKALLELVASFSSDLASIPYEKEKDNETKRRFWNELIYKESKRLESNEENCLNTKSAITINSSFSPDKTNTSPLFISLYEKWPQRFAMVFKKLMKWNEGELKDSFGYILFYKCFQSEELSEKTKFCVYMKLLYLYAHIYITENQDYISHLNDGIPRETLVAQ